MRCSNTATLNTIAAIALIVMSQNELSTTEQRTIEKTSATVDPQEFLARERGATEFGRYIRIFPDADAAQLHCYREVGGRDDVEYIRTIIPTSSMRFYTGDEPVRWDLHDKHAETFLTWLSTFCGDSASIWWDSRNNTALIDEAGLNQETLSLEGEHKIVIDNVYQHASQMMANYK